MIFRISLALMLLAIALPASAKTIETRTVFGTVVLIEETRTRDPGEPLIMHAVTEWTKLRLHWEASDEGFNVELIDDGGTLSIEQKGHDCASGGGLQRYEQRTGEDRLWRIMNASLAELTKLCPRISREQAVRYAAGLRAAHDDFIAAVEAMKRRALALYQRPLRRCRPAKRFMPAIDPFASPCDGVW